VSRVLANLWRPSRPPARSSGSWGDHDLERQGFRGGVVVPGTALERELDRGERLKFSFLVGCGAAAVDVQGWHTVMPVADLIVVEQLYSQLAHRTILQFPHFIKRAP
jgi:hypothetical protein